MSFLWTPMLFALLLIPLFVVLYMRIQQQRRQIAASYGRLGLIQREHKLGARRHIPPLLFLLSLTILIVALARPQMMVSLPRVEGTVILAFDISGSMAAADLEPTRMEAAKMAAQDFVDNQPPNVQIGVVAFSDSGLAVQVPTYDRDAVLATINRMAPERGTSLGNGILASLNTLATSAEPDPSFYTNLTPLPPVTPTPMPEGTYRPAAIILLTDGENTAPPDPLIAAQTAADYGVRIYTVGIGSATGANLEIDGFTIHTQLDEGMLQQIALLTDGIYYNAETEEDLVDIYSNLNPQLVLKSEPTEITSIFAGIGILVLLLGGTLSLLWFGRLP
jgi:Ca-activated chloride channel homolog